MSDFNPNEIVKDYDPKDDYQDPHCDCGGSKFCTMCRDQPPIYSDEYYESLRDE